MFSAYIETSGAGPSTLRNPDVALAEKASERLTVPAPQAPPSILLSKKQRQAVGFLLFVVWYWLIQIVRS
jgi:hypothetical protein